MLVKNDLSPCLCSTGVTTAGRANSVTTVWFILDACMEPATSPGSASVKGTGVACCVIKVCSLSFCYYFTSSYTRWWQNPRSVPQLLKLKRKLSLFSYLLCLLDQLKMNILYLSWPVSHQLFSFAYFFVLTELKKSRYIGEFRYVCSKYYITTTTKTANVTMYSLSNCTKSGCWSLNCGSIFQEKNIQAW